MPPESPVPAPPPRLFRRRLRWVMLATALLPLLAIAGLGHLTLERLLSFSFAPLEQVLDDVAPAVNAWAKGPGVQPGVQEELRQARLWLAQAELARRSLGHLASVWILAVAVLTLAATLGCAMMLGRSLASPVEQLAAGIGRYVRGELGFRLEEPPAHAADELAFLVRQFNRMGDELEAQRERLAAAEKLGAWQEVARAVAHELKNPLTGMKLAIGRLARVAQSPDQGDARRISESLSLLGDEVDVLMRLTQSFTTFARLPPPSPAPLALRALLEEVCALYREGGPVPVPPPSGPELVLRADADGLRRAFGNLVKNAVEASAEGDPPVRVALEVAGARVRVTIQDGGVGIAGPLDGNALTRGLVTTKAKGSGLGLPLAQKIVHDHGGSLRLEPSAPRGTIARVELPIADGGHEALG